MTRRAVIALLAWAALMAAGIAAATAREHEPPIATTPPTATTASACDWQAEYDGTLAELGEDPRDWVVMSGDSITGASGLAFSRVGMAAVNPDIPCWDVATTVRHEWMHLQEARHYGEQAEAVLGSRERIELVADCGAMMLADGHTNSSFYPYVRASIQNRGVGCLPADLQVAAALIAVPAA